MAYGLRIKDASSNVLLDTSYQLSRFRYSNQVSSGASDNVVLSDINGLTSVQFSIATDSIQVCHAVTRSGTTISWTANSGTRYNSSNSLVYVFLIT